MGKKKGNEIQQRELELSRPEQDTVSSNFKAIFVRGAKIENSVSR
jgi:hypothetical protein